MYDPVESTIQEHRKRKNFSDNKTGEENEEGASVLKAPIKKKGKKKKRRTNDNEAREIK